MISPIQKISQNLSNYPLSKSLKKLVFVIWLLPYILISVISIFLLSHTLISRELGIAQMSFEVTKDNLNGIISDIQNVSDRFAGSNGINVLPQNVLSGVNEYFGSMPEVLNCRIYIEENEDDYRLYGDDDDGIHAHPQTVPLKNDENPFENDDASSDELYGLYGEKIIQTDKLVLVKSTESIKKEDWYNVAIRLRGQSFWMYKEDLYSQEPSSSSEESSEKYLCLVRSVWDNRRGEFLGNMIVNVNPESVEERISSRLFKTLVLFNNEIIYSTKSISLKNRDREKFITLMKDYDFNEPKIVLLNGGLNPVGVLAYKFFQENNLNFKLAFIFPFRQLLGLSHKVFFALVAILITLAFLTVLLLRIFTGYIDSRVNKIQTGIKSVVSNNFAIVPGIGGNDEFQDIYHSLYEMSNNLKNLINQVYAQNLEKEQLSSRQNEIRFRMLSTQINPHFLFNTLETIRMKSISSGDREVARMLKQLASLLRYNLNISGKPVCFFDELTAVQNYLSIQHVRFGNRISYDIVVLCNVNRISILPLLLQPIIENCFAHGLENTAENGFIYVLCETAIKDSEEILRISISDNGSGIEKKKLEDLQRKLDGPYSEENDYKEDGNASIGIFNVNSRIKLYYGQKYGLQLQSKSVNVNDDESDGTGTGTKVTVELPLVYL